jgi:hypothetical protein
MNLNPVRDTERFLFQFYLNLIGTKKTKAVQRCALANMTSLKGFALAVK